MARIHGRLQGRHHLRRVSPDKARRLASKPRRAPIEKRAEKLGVAILLGGLVAALLGSGVAEDGRAWAGVVALVAILVAGVVRYLADFRRGVLQSLSRVVGLGVLLVLPLAGIAVYERFVGPTELTYLPISLVSLVLALAWSRAVAIDGTVVSTALLLLYVGLRSRLDGAGLSGLGVAFGGGMAAALAAEAVKRRSSLVRIGFVIGAVQAALAAIVLLLGQAEPVPADLVELARVGLSGIIVGLLATGLLPAIETLFDVTTDISLLELGNTHEAPLLRKLLIEAPGTFHHSYVAGLLAESAAEEIGANALLARVGALYHDIGKLNKPEYFAEASPEARRRHDDLAPEMSMLIISAHPRDGMELGRYYGLPQAVLDFMPQHHGTSCIEFFYQRALKLRGEENVSEESFRYAGPKPQTKEAAIVMIADAAEAIGRQMPDPNRARLVEMVHRVAMKRLMDGQFAECGLTLAELEKIEGACVQVLTAIHHIRPTFPKGKPHPLDLSQPSRPELKVEPPPVGRERMLPARK